MVKKSEWKPLHCSFCSKEHREVRKLVVGPPGVQICDECALLCLDILIEDRVSLDDCTPSFSGQAACGFALDVGMARALEDTTRCAHCHAQWRTSDVSAREHLSVCAKHPMREVERERDELREGMRRMALLLPEGSP